MKNNQLSTLITQLKRLAAEQQRPLWRRVAADLEQPTRQRRIVNLWALEQHAKDGEILLVPGKVLGDGELTKKITVAAAAYSEEARRKLVASGGSILTIAELAKKHPDAKNVRIIG